MIINENNKKLVHHLLAYECDEDFIPPSKFGQECGSVPLPSEVNQKCSVKMFIAWGIGGQLASQNKSVLKIIYLQ